MGFLKNAGFLMLSLPQSDVSPLQLLVRTSSGTVERLNASIEDLFIPQTIAPPDVSGDKVLPEVEGEEDLSTNVTADVSFLKGLEKFFGLKGSADFSYEQGRVFKIKLDGPKLNTINVITLAGFIKDARVNSAAGDIADKLNDSEVYVITEVIKAKSFRVERAYNQQVKEEVKVSVPGIAEGSQGVDVDKKDNSVLQYNGDTPLTFALKAYRFTASGGGWFSSGVTYTIESAKDIELVREGRFHGEPLESPGGIKFLNLSAHE